MPMPRFMPCVALASLLAACTPVPKAIEIVEETTKPVPAPKSGEPTLVSIPGEPLPTARRSGMILPDVLGKLPEDRDFQPTVDTAQSVIRATPPPPGKLRSE